MEYLEMIGSIYDDDLSTAQILSSDSILLSPEQLDWAIDQSNQVANEARQWQTYLNMLALIGTQAWLQKRLPLCAADLNVADLQIAQSPQSDQTLGCQYQLTVRQSQRQFQFCLLTTDCLADPLVAVPKSSLESSPLPDFYVLVEVLEELSEVRVQGYLTYAQLQTECDLQSENAVLGADLDTDLGTDLDTGLGAGLGTGLGTGLNTGLSPDLDTVLLPIDCFNLDPDSLLLHLRTAMAIEPTVPVTLMRTNTQSTAAEPTLSQLAINVGLWLQNRLDQVAERAWILLSPAELNLSGALMGASMRGISSDLNLVVRELQRHQAVLIPADARVAYHDFQLEEAAARLYVLIWVPAHEPAEPPEWSMLLILGGQPDQPAPVGLTLKVEEFNSVTQQTGQQLAAATLAHDPYLYVQIVGAWEEQFRVSITADTGATLSLPIFEFNPDTVT
jgi:hypothetical protein